MIKPINIEDKKIVSEVYLDNEFNIVDKDKATLVKIIFDDNTLLFGIPEKVKLQLKIY